MGIGRGRHTTAVAVAMTGGLLGPLAPAAQDAYASRYRVQVSADGRTWRTAANRAGGYGRA